MTGLRHIDEGPWCWASKGALRRIREAFDVTNDVTSALGVYWALCEVASDKASPEFQTTHAWLSGLSGLSPRTIQARLKQLQEIGLISIHTPALRTASTYRLLAFGNGCATKGNGCAAFGNGASPPSLPTLEERVEEQRRKGNGQPKREPDWVIRRDIVEAIKELEDQRKEVMKRFPRGAGADLYPDKAAKCQAEIDELDTQLSALREKLKELRQNNIA